MLKKLISSQQKIRSDAELFIPTKLSNKNILMVLNILKV